MSFILGDMPGTNKTKRRQLARARVLNKLAKEPTTAAFFTMPERSQLRDLQNEGLITIGADYRWRRTSCLRCGNHSTMRMKDNTTMMCEEHGTFYAGDFK